MNLRFATANENDIFTRVRSADLEFQNTAGCSHLQATPKRYCFSAELPSPEWGVIQKPRATPWETYPEIEKPQRDAIAIPRLRRLTHLNRDTQGVALGFCIAPHSGLEADQWPADAKRALFS